MIAGIKNITALALILANLVPLVGISFFNWQLKPLIFLYWSENLIIGFYNIIKLASIRVRKPTMHLKKLITIPIFIFHFGAFCIGHFVLLLALFGSIEENSLSIADWPYYSIFFEHLEQFFKDSDLLSNYLIIPFACLFLSHGISTLYNFFFKGEYKDSISIHLMLEPYWRVIFLHIAIIIGAYSVTYFNTPYFLLVFLVFIKIIIDLYLHIKQNKLIPNSN
ncbi:MAG: hypothetical protein GWO07_12265 [Candidatus Dadabacteria bacterium]|nr:hypothetical protein [Candidatus Dadabacteria bacterium]NIV42944.1 hypothetical protein [Candidatus Dadabacteria bacterium]NIX16003.1 hypothetical protein [Candidatus Dadabacteria bacterium]